MFSLNAHAPEIDSLLFTNEDEKSLEGIPLHSTPIVFVSGLNSASNWRGASNSRRRLSTILHELIDQTGLEIPIEMFANAGLDRLSDFSSIRLVVDLWSNSSERELRDTASMTYSLFRTIGQQTAIDILACVYPARQNRRIYRMLADGIRFDQSDIHGITYTPRIATFGDKIRSTTGLRASLFSFLAV